MARRLWMNQVILLKNISKDKVSLIMKTPVFITNFNLCTWPKAMVGELQRMKDCGHIIIIDNNSTYKPTLEWYDSLNGNDDVSVILTGKNHGHLVLWQLGLDKWIKKEFGYSDYIATDPDLDLSECPDDTIARLREIWYDSPSYPYIYQDERGIEFNGFRLNVKDKIGLGIRTDDIPQNALFFQPAEHRYKKQPIYNNLNLVPVDTTFAFHNVDTYQVCISGARTLPPYEMRHLPYYITPEEMKTNFEFQQYLDKASHSSTAKKIADGIKID